MLDWLCGDGQCPAALEMLGFGGGQCPAALLSSVLGVLLSPAFLNILTPLTRAHAHTSPRGYKYGNNLPSSKTSSQTAQSLAPLVGQVLLNAELSQGLEGHDQAQITHCVFTSLTSD